MGARISVLLMGWNTNTHFSGTNCTTSSYSVCIGVAVPPEDTQQHQFAYISALFLPLCCLLSGWRHRRIGVDVGSTFVGRPPLTPSVLPLVARLLFEIMSISQHIHPVAQTLINSVV